MRPRCSECGCDGALNREGVCVFRARCEQTVAVHDGEVRRLLAEMTRLDPHPCGHTDADHEAQLRAAWGVPLDDDGGDPLL